mmetsp:Transcript_27419/g.20572  ORF Transcript_27419/g.20572 Transcript_27419/m.20572 type:complete len:242 (-) Transcript_27419:99-824(-)
MKYSGEAEARDKQKDLFKTMIIRLLDGLSSLHSGDMKSAAEKLVQVPLVEDARIYEVLSPQDLAFYVTITALHSENRKDLKDKILMSSQFKNLMESVPETTDIIENYLNGKYQDFQQALQKIQQGLKYDAFFGHKLDDIIAKIRRKALVQYVTPYKVIDLREIAKEFNLSLEFIEAEIASLIVDKKIQAKIDSHSKLLYSRKENETLNSYKETVELGKQFIQNTEIALLRIQMIQKKKVLK